MPFLEINIAKEETSRDQPAVPADLFHTILTVIDASTAPNHRAVYPLNTHAELGAAKAFAAKALEGLDYSRSDFDSFQSVFDDDGKADNNKDQDKTLPEGVLVRAQRADMHEFLVSIYTTSNTESLAVKSEDPAQLQLPNGTNLLHYVLQTKIDYNADRSDGVYRTDIEGVYVHRQDAARAAATCLISDPIRPEDFAEYDEKGSDVLKGEWPYGEDVLVHAVSNMGETFEVAVLTPLRSQIKRAKK